MEEFKEIIQEDIEYLEGNIAKRKVIRKSKKDSRIHKVSSMILDGESDDKILSYIKTEWKVNGKDYISKARKRLETYNLEVFMKMLLSLYYIVDMEENDESEIIQTNAKITLYYLSLSSRDQSKAKFILEGFKRRLDVYIATSKQMELTSITRNLEMLKNYRGNDSIWLY